MSVLLQTIGEGCLILTMVLAIVAPLAHLAREHFRLKNQLKLTRECLNRLIDEMNRREIEELLKKKYPHQPQLILLREKTDV